MKKFEEGVGEIGCLISEVKLRKNCKLKLTMDSYKITENLYLLGEIPRLNDFEGNESIKKVLKNEEYGSGDFDNLYGGNNDDLIYGGENNDTIHGDNGNDTALLKCA